ncbi:MAG: DUF2383 domain-containing protein [Pseudomonadota bacterium]
MSKRLENLNSIVGVLAASAKFYRQSARQAGNADLERIFLEHADLRETTGRNIAQVIDDAGAEPAEAAAGEQARAMAAKVGTLFNDTAETLVGSLEEHEDRTLEVFRNAIHHKDNNRDEQMLRDYMAEFEKSHERMRQLKQAKNPKSAAADV